MKGYLARETGCSGTTSVERGLYSSIVIVPFCARTAIGTTASASLCMNWMFFEQCNYLMTQLPGKSHAIMWTGAGSRDRIANPHRHGARFDNPRSERQNLARTLERHGNQRNSCFDRDKRSAFLEFAHFTGPRAPAFRKDQQGDSFIPDHLRCQGHRLHCCPRILARHPDVAGATKVPSEERDLKQPSFCQKTETHRNVPESHWRIHVAQVI